MIRVEILREVRGRGVFDWRVDGLMLGGRSRQPLLDACRRVLSTGAVTAHEQIGIYRKGREEPDAKCSVGWGAAHTVDEAGPRFRKWKPFVDKGQSHDDRSQSPSFSEAACSGQGTGD